MPATITPITATPTPAPAPVTVNLPNGTNPTGTTGITPNQYALQPGEMIDAYNARIAGLRSAQGEPTYTGAPTDTTSAQDQVAQSLGYKSYSDAVGQLTAAPTQSETDLYNSAYSAAGLDQLQSTITGRQNDLNTATGTINDNPWLDEATRVGRTKTLTDMANADIKNYQDEYNTKLKSVEDLVKQETDDQNTTTTANKTKLAALEAQAKALVTQTTAQQKAATTAPKTVKGATGATYQWNAATNSFTQILPGKNTATSSAATKPTPQSVSQISSAMQSVAGSDGYISPQSWQQALNEWTAAGYSTASFVTNFKAYANTKDPSNNYAGLK